MHRTKGPLVKGGCRACEAGGLGTQFESAKHLDGSLQSLHRLEAVPLPLTREVLVLRTSKGPLVKGGCRADARLGDWVRSLKLRSTSMVPYNPSTALRRSPSL